MAKPTKRRRRKAARRRSPAPPRTFGTEEDRSPAAATVAVPAPDDRPEPDVVIVAVGASAGGLEAFSQLLDALPREPGFAMVLVQHLAPRHSFPLVEGVGGVAPAAPRVAHRQPDEHARQAGEGRFPLDALVDLVDEQFPRLQHP